MVGWKVGRGVGGGGDINYHNYTDKSMGRAKFLHICMGFVPMR